MGSYPTELRRNERAVVAGTVLSVEEVTMSLREAVRALGIPARQVLDLIDKGQLPAYKSNGDLVLRQSDVEAQRL